MVEKKENYTPPIRHVCAWLIAKWLWVQANRTILTELVFYNHSFPIVIVTEVLY